MTAHTSAQQSARPAFKIDDGRACLQQGIELLESMATGTTIGQMLGHTPEEMESLYAQGFALYAQGKYAEAEKAFHALLLCNHVDRRVHKAYAACLQMQGRHAEAIRHHVMCAARDVLDPEPVFHAAECMLAIGKRDEARATIEHLLAIAPADAAGTAQADFRARAEGLLRLMDDAS